MRCDWALEFRNGNNVTKWFLYVIRFLSTFNRSHPRRQPFLVVELQFNYAPWIIQYRNDCIKCIESVELHRVEYFTCDTPSLSRITLFVSRFKIPKWRHCNEPEWVPFYQNVRSFLGLFSSFFFHYERVKKWASVKSTFIENAAINLNMAYRVGKKPWKCTCKSHSIRCVEGTWNLDMTASLFCAFIDLELKFLNN